MRIYGRAAASAVAMFVVGTGTASAQPSGRAITSDDWTDRIPILIGAIVVVLIVNGIGMYFVSLSRKNERAAGSGGLQPGTPRPARTSPSANGDGPPA